MRFARILVPMAAAFWATATVVAADQHAHAPVPHPTHAHGTPATITPSTPQAPTTTKHAAKSASTHSSTTSPHAGRSTTTHGTTTPGTTTTTGGTTPSTHTGGTHHDGDHHSGLHHDADHHSAPHHDADHHSGPHTPPPSPVATKIQSHPKLAAKVTAMLPPGMTMNQAARGFKNQGQFIAALHASQRTGIPFADLRRAMVVQHESLGQAIHSLRPSANHSREAEHAEHEADHDLGGSHSGAGGATTGTTTTSTTATSTTARKHDE
jgi:hypothetical protein